MGLFGKLFEKKICDICGGEIGLLGNRKLEDGNMCKNCAKKLSPFFDERRHSTIAQIKEQLAYREANKAEVAAFRVTRTYGENYTKLLVDEEAGKFMVTSADDLEEANPDVIAFADVTGCTVEINDSYEEITYQDKDGNECSFKPPHYRFEYDFELQLRVRNPYFDDISFRLNDESVVLERQLRLGYTPEAFRDDKRLFNPEDSREYSRYLELAEEIRVLLMERGNEAEPAQANQRAGVAAPVQPYQPAGAAAAPAAPVQCPYCGAATMPDAAGCCEYCGGTLNG